MKKSNLPHAVKIIWSVFLLLSFQQILLANVAQPGMWQAGGMANFSLMFSEDSTDFRKIQMVDERVSILLYPGFAVVKGEYWMQNDTDSLIQIKTGYPINSSAQSDRKKLMQIWFEELYGLKILSDGKNIPLLQEEKIDNWYVWENVFPKKTTTKIEVYFLMNTNSAQVLQGYTKDYRNGFVYLLETGAIWKQPIIKGELRLQTKDDLEIKNIRGIYPQDFFAKNSTEQILLGQFEKLSPTAENNVVISYGKKIEDFDFVAILKNQENYFSEVDQFSRRDLSKIEFMTTSFANPFVIPDFDGIRPTGLLSWVTLIFYFVIVLLGSLLLRWIWRKFLK